MSGRLAARRPLLDSAASGSLIDSPPMATEQQPGLAGRNDASWRTSPFAAAVSGVCLDLAFCRGFEGGDEALGCVLDPGVVAGGE